MTLLNGMPATFVEVALRKRLRCSQRISQSSGPTATRHRALGNRTPRRHDRARSARGSQTGDGSSLSREPAVASSAPRRSSSKSATSSIPTESRRSPSVIPRRSRSLSGIEPCVMRPGWQMSDSTPPRLSARLKYCKRLAKSSARFGRPFELEREHAAETAHLPLRKRVLGMGAQARIVNARDVVA